MRAENRHRGDAAVGFKGPISEESSLYCTEITRILGPIVSNVDMEKASGCKIVQA